MCCAALRDPLAAAFLRCGILSRSGGCSAAVFALRDSPAAVFLLRDSVPPRWLLCCGSFFRPGSSFCCRILSRPGVLFRGVHPL